MLLPFCAVSVFFSFRVPAFLLLVLVVVHFIERLRFSFGVPSFSFRMILFLSALGLFVRLVPPCLFFVLPSGLLLSVWRVSLLFAAISLSGLCVSSSCAPSFFVVGFAGSSPPFVCFLRFRLLSRSFARFALLCFVVLVLVVAGSVLVCGRAADADEEERVLGTVRRSHDGSVSGGVGVMVVALCWVVSMLGRRGVWEGDGHAAVKIL